MQGLSLTNQKSTASTFDFTYSDHIPADKQIILARLESSQKKMHYLVNKSNPLINSLSNNYPEQFQVITGLLNLIKEINKKLVILYQALLDLVNNQFTPDNYLEALDMPKILGIQQGPICWKYFLCGNIFVQETYSVDLISVLDQLQFFLEKADIYYKFQKKMNDEEQYIQYFKGKLMLQERIADSIHRYGFHALVPPEHDLLAWVKKEDFETQFCMKKEKWEYKDLEDHSMLGVICNEMNRNILRANTSLILSKSTNYLTLGFNYLKACLSNSLTEAKSSESLSNPPDEVLLEGYAMPQNSGLMKLCVNAMSPKIGMVKEIFFPSELMDQLDEQESMEFCAQFLQKNISTKEKIQYQRKMSDKQEIQNFRKFIHEQDIFKKNTLADLNRNSLQEINQNHVQLRPSVEDPAYPRFTQINVISYKDISKKGSNVLSFKDLPKNKLRIVMSIGGGGFIHGFSQIQQMNLRNWSKAKNVVFYQLVYSLAPKYKFPYGLNDIIASYKFIIYYYQEIAKVELESIMMIGDSAGGNFVAALLNYLIVTDFKKRPDMIFLFFPASNLNLERYNPSMIKAFEHKVLYFTVMEKCIQHYCNQGVSDSANNFFISPVATPLEILKKYPRVFMACGSEDPLLDDTTNFAIKLDQAGVNCKTFIYKNLPHGFLNFSVKVPSVKEAQKDLLNAFDLFLDP